MKKHHRAIAALMIVSAVLGMMLVNWGSERLDARFNLTADLTEIGITSFDENTIRLVESLPPEKEIYIYTVFQNSTNSELRAQIERVLMHYQALSGVIKTGNIDPLQEPARIRQFTDSDTLAEGSLIVSNADASRSKVIERDAYYYGYSMQQGDRSYKVFDAESMITSAIYAVSSDKTPKVYFLQGHGELDVEAQGTWSMTMLQENNYQPLLLDGVGKDCPLEAGDVLAIINPQLDITEQEARRLYDWMQTGGRLLVNIDYRTDLSKEPNLVKFLSYFNLAFGEGYVEENQLKAEYWRGEVYALVPQMNDEHEITAGLKEGGISVYMPLSRPILPVTFPEFGYTYTPLLTSSPQARNVVDGIYGPPGEQIVALAMQKDDHEDPSRNIRGVLLGGSNILADTNMLYSTYNPLFLSGVFDWLVNQKTDLSVRMKYVQDQMLTIPNEKTAWMIGGVVVIALPLLVFLIGAAVCIKRRRA